MPFFHRLRSWRQRRPNDASQGAGKGSQIYIPAQWRGADDPLAWRDDQGNDGQGRLADLPPLATPSLILGWPSVTWLEAPLPPTLQHHPQALAAALEERLLAPPETVWALAPERQNQGLVCAVTDQSRLRRLLDLLGSRQIYPARALPEVWQGVPGELVLSAQSGWCCGANGRPILLDAWHESAPPAVLACLFDPNSPVTLSLRLAPAQASPDRQAWSQTLGQPVLAGPPWLWWQDEAANQGHRPNLLQFELRPRPAPTRALSRILRPLALALLSLVMLELGMNLADWGRQAWRQRDLRTQVMAAYRQAFPGEAPVLSPLLQARRSLGQLRRQAGEWAEDDFVPLTSRALPLLQSLPPGSLKSLSLEDHSLLLEIAGGEQQHNPLLKLADKAGLSARWRPDGRLSLMAGGLE